MRHPCEWLARSVHLAWLSSQPCLDEGRSICSWNFTPSPGWTKEESQILKLCLMKFGVGQWLQILSTGLLPGKLIQQLNGATQRLLGQQSLAGKHPYDLSWQSHIKTHGHVPVHLQRTRDFRWTSTASEQTMKPRWTLNESQG